MNEKPILFSGAMVKAILEGRKTQTRRVLKYEIPDGFYPVPGHVGKWSFQRPAKKHLHIEMTEIIRCPYGYPGMRLWVRETFALICDDWPCQCETDEFHHYEYRADTNDPYPGQWPVEEAKGNPEAPKWRPSIFMPRKASRIALEITKVRVERLQDISHEDAVAEGCYEIKGESWGRLRFSQLWDSINAKRGYGWDVNPWVWVVEFKPE